MIKRLLTPLIVLGCLALIFSPGIAQQPSQEVVTGGQVYIPLLWKTVPHEWIGPEGGVITALVFDKHNPANIYAGTWDGGVYKSTNGGGTWNRASQGLGNLKIVSLATDPANPAILYAGTYKGKVFKSIDGAATWQAASNGIQEDAIVYSIVIDPQNTQRLYAATRGISNNGDRPWAGVVYRSEDGGSSWTPSLSDLGGAGYQDWVYALEINPNAPQMIFAATHEHGPLRSIDYGNTWKILDNGIDNHSTRAIVVDPRLDYANIVYTGVWTRDGVYKSFDSGDSWESRNKGLTDANIYRLVVNPSLPQILFAGTYNLGVMRTTNAGNYWSSAGLAWVGIASLQVSPADGQTVFAGTDGDGLYRSGDGGQNWTHNQSGLTANPVTSLVVSTSQPSTYFISLYGGSVMRSQDAGLSWSKFNQELGERYVHALVKPPLQNTLFALTESAGLYRLNLEDPNARWVKVDLGAMQAVPPATLEDSAPISASSETFQQLFEPPATTSAPSTTAVNVPLLSLVFAPSDASIAYLGTYGAGIYTSMDGGNTWSASSWANQIVGSIAIHPQDPQIIYATTGQPETIGASQDGGVTWNELKIPGVSVNVLAIPAEQPNVLLAGTNTGLYRHSNGAWKQIGLAGENVTALSINPNRPEMWVAGTTRGAWISLDAGSTWRAGPFELDGIPVKSISFSPHNAELIFYNTTANGILRTGYAR